jgi:hypothetical protein
MIKILTFKNFIRQFIILLSLVLLNTSIYGQTEKLEIKVIENSTSLKQELYTKARSIIAYKFKNSNYVIQMDDKESGRIICKGVMIVHSTGTLGINYNNYVNFNLTIDVKDNRFRAVISDIYHAGITSSNEYQGGAIENEKPDCGTFSIPKKDWNKMKEAIVNDANLFLEEFKKEMITEIKVDDF